MKPTILESESSLGGTPLDANAASEVKNTESVPAAVKTSEIKSTAQKGTPE